MIISFLIHAVAGAMYQTFSYFACSATAVNPTVAYVKFMVKRWATIAVMEKQQSNHPLLLDNAPEPPKKEPGAETEPPMPAEGVIYIN